MFAAGLIVKILKPCLFALGGLNVTSGILLAAETTHNLLAIITGLCGFLTLVIGCVVASYLKHLSNHNAVMDKYVQKENCELHVKGLTEKLDRLIERLIDD